MNDKIPKLLRDSIEQNDYDIDVITKKLKLPWLKLDIKLDEPTQEEIKQMYSNADWREKWNYPTLTEDSYQVKGWNGDVFFGPKDWTEFLELNMQDQKEHDHDEDSKCRKFRKLIPYGWYVNQEHYLRRQLKKIIPNDDDINLVNSYSLPPKGYVFPHRDYAIDGMGLARIHHGLATSHAEMLEILVKRGPPFPERRDVGVILPGRHWLPATLEVLGRIVWWCGRIFSIPVYLLTPCG